MKTVPEIKYLQQKDLAIRYNVSNQQIYNLIKMGRIPPPMKLYNKNLWPVELLDKMDSERNKIYFDTLDNKWKSKF